MKTLIKIIKEQFIHKKQIIKMANEIFKNTYKSNKIEFFLKPIITIFSCFFAFAIALEIGKRTNGFPYFLWLISGLIPWFYMKDMLIEGTECVEKYGEIAKQQNLPLSTIPTIINMSKFLIHVSAVYLMIVIFRLFGYTADIYLVQLPFYMLLAFIFFNIWGLFSGLIAVQNKKYRNFIIVIIEAIFWLSGIMWKPSAIKNKILRKILRLNPITYLVNGYRNCFINKVWFWKSPKTLLCFILIMIVLGIFALCFYKKQEKQFNN